MVLLRGKQVNLNEEIESLLLLQRLQGENNCQPGFEG